VGTNCVGGVVARSGSAVGRGVPRGPVAPGGTAARAELVAAPLAVLAVALVCAFALGLAAPGVRAGAATARAASTKAVVVHVNTVESATSNTQTVVLTGGIGDAGTLSVTGPSSTVDLSKGTIVIDLSKGIGAENKLFAHLRTVVSPQTCSMDRSYTAPVAITSGTGAYAGISGTLVVRTTEVGVFPRTASGSCDLSSSAQPVGFLSLGDGSGTVKL
jgi:hypothetical protein